MMLRGSRGLPEATQLVSGGAVARGLVLGTLQCHCPVRVGAVEDGDVAAAAVCDENVHPACRLTHIPS